MHRIFTLGSLKMFKLTQTYGDVLIHSSRCVATERHSSRMD